jgi:alpha-galactosidase
MKRLSILVTCLFLAACGTTTKVASDVPGDVPTDTPTVEPCGNGTCDPGETCWTCPADCACACGDGVCTHGEACFNCPADCDCATLGATPPMGWNSWNKFACDISQTLAIEIADAMVDTGMKDAGYRYLNLDDCWQVSRAEDGTIVADPTRFADGMKTLADTVHARGLKFGVYTCAGTMTCQERPGSKDFEDQDMATYAEWGVDLVKVDWCFAEGLNAKTQYDKFRSGIARTGRGIVLSLCNWGLQDPWVWGADMGQLWRTSGDISDTWFSMMINLELAEGHAPYAGPGHWNDPDMLEVGNGGMTTEEYRSHMSLWAITASPLIAGNDLRTMDDTTRDILTNAEVIAVDQDPLGLQGVRLVQGDGFAPDVWARPLAHPGWRAVVVFNRGFDEATADLATVDLGLAPGTVKVRDLWTHQDVGSLGTTFPVVLPPNSARMFRVEGAEPRPPAGESFLSDLPWIYMASSRGPAERDRSNGLIAAGDGEPLALRGTTFAKGIGAYAGSIVVIPLGGRCTTFRADVGVDDAAAGAGSTSFEVWADGRKLFDSGVMTGADAARPVQVDLDGTMMLKLVTTAASDNEDKDFADWAGARIVCR